MDSTFGDYPSRFLYVQNVIFTVELFRATVKASKFSFAELIKAQASKNNSVFLIENLA